MVVQLWERCLTCTPVSHSSAHGLRKDPERLQKEKLCIFKPIVPHLFLHMAKFFSCVIINIEPKNRVSEYYSVLSGPVDIEDYALWEYKFLGRRDYNEHITAGA